MPRKTSGIYITLGLTVIFYGTTGITEDNRLLEAEQAARWEKAPAGSPATFSKVPETSDALGASSWRTDQVMVTSSSDLSLEQLAAEHGVRVVRAPNRSGAGAISVPEGVPVHAFLQTLRRDQRIHRVNPVGLVRGAGSRDNQDYRASPHQWHLTATRAPLAGSVELGRYVVAVLDTGVAYEDHPDEDAYVLAPSLADIDFVAPYDFVNDDEHPNDDHQHGTHITSLIASEGDVEGLAAGVSIMPLKVLDADNTGTELDLIDAIYWAVDNGADVINMSLSFPVGYVPSIELQEALDYAASADTVMVAATGNEGLDLISWPAASRSVIAVAAARPGKWDDQQAQGNWDNKATFLADYSNRGLAVDLCAPGGAVDHDRTGDGVLDGIMAETIDPDDPSSTGYWVFTGSSQAAAQVSAAAVHLLALGAEPNQVSLALQYNAFDEGFDGQPYESGGGAGGLNLEEAEKAIEEEKDEVQFVSSYHAAVVPFIAEKDAGDKIRPQAYIALVDDSGAPVTDGEVFATVWASGMPTVVSCDLENDGTCIAYTDWYDIDEDEVPEAFTITVEGYSNGEAMSRPGKLLFATDGGELLLSAIDNTSKLDDALLAFRISGDKDGGIFEDAAESYAVINMGTGLSSSPMGLVFRPGALEADSTVTAVELDLDAVELTDEEMGTLEVELVELDGTGLSASPMGFTTLRLVAVDGTGLSASPMGFHISHLFGPSSGTGLSASPMGFTGNPLLLGHGEAIGVSVEGFQMDSLLDGSGQQTEDGYELASLLASSNAVGTDLSISSVSASGLVGGIPLSEATQ